MISNEELTDIFAVNRCFQCGGFAAPCTAKSVFLSMSTKAASAIIAGPVRGKTRSAHAFAA